MHFFKYMKISQIISLNNSKIWSKTTLKESIFLFET